MKKIVISIDGNYDTQFDAGFMFFMLKKAFKNKDIRTFKIDSAMSPQQITSEIGDIQIYLESSDIVFINGGLAEPIVADLVGRVNVADTIEKYSDVTRYYSYLSHSTRMFNFLLIRKDQDRSITEGFKTIDSTTLALNFNMIQIESDHLNLSQILKIITDRLTDEGVLL